MNLRLGTWLMGDLDWNWILRSMGARVMELKRWRGGCVRAPLGRRRVFVEAGATSAGRGLPRGMKVRMHTGGDAREKRRG